jgi:phospholipase C
VARTHTLALTLLFTLTACGREIVTPSNAVVAPPDAAVSPIKHVVFIIQENRSFNNLFLGYPGATTQAYGYDEAGRKVSLHPQGLATTWDLSHSAKTFFEQCDARGTLPGTHCKMDGWNHGRERHDPPNAPYAYVPRDEIAPYWEIAQQYVLADRTFASNLDGSFIAHQYAVAAYASRGVDWPIGTSWGCEGGPTDTIPTLTQVRTYGPSIRACFDNPTIASESDTAGVTWRFYAGAIDRNGGIWSAYQADRKVFYGADWSADVISPASRFLRDVARGTLANVTWITPIWENSDHPGLLGSGGPHWVASLVNAVGESKFWKTTAIFIMWDDWGGWFDPVRPVYEDYDGLGFRVPLIIVSPYAKQGYVTHVQYETASVLRFIEDNFGLPQLARSDRRANDPAGDAFDYRQKPRRFEKIHGGRPASYWAELDRRDAAVRMPADDGNGD